MTASLPTKPIESATVYFKGDSSVGIPSAHFESPIGPDKARIIVKKQNVVDFIRRMPVAGYLNNADSKRNKEKSK